VLGRRPAAAENAGFDVINVRKETTERGWAPAGSDEVQVQWTIRTDPARISNGERQA
jgi:hypothetical protein